MKARKNSAVGWSSQEKTLDKHCEKGDAVSHSSSQSSKPSTKQIAALPTNKKATSALPDPHRNAEEEKKGKIRQNKPRKNAEEEKNKER